VAPNWHQTGRQAEGKTIGGYSTTNGAIAVNVYLCFCTKTPDNIDQEGQIGVNLKLKLSKSVVYRLFFCICACISCIFVSLLSYNQDVELDQKGYVTRYEGKVVP